MTTQLFGADVEEVGIQKRRIAFDLAIGAFNALILVFSGMWLPLQLQKVTC